jgi:hypothetical protein
LGSLSILLALLLVALSEHRTPSSWLYLMVSALTLAVTITNWMAGIFATFMRYPWKGSLQISFAALGLVTALWGIEKLVFPSARFFVGHFDSEAPFLLTQLSAGSLNVINAFAFHSMIMPAINVGFLTCYPNAEERVMLTQLSLPGSGTSLGLIAVVIWLALLALGMWALLSVSRHRSLRMALGLTLLGQLVLHLLYGEETFLYSLHFTPLLVLLAALSTLTPVRVVVLVLASVLVLCGGINNGLQLSKALQVFPQHAAGEHPEFPTYEHHGGWIFEAQACRFTTTVHL